MILLFPDADTFRLALTGGFVPADVLASPAAVSFDPDGRVHLDTAAKLPKKATEELKRLGVLGARRHHADPTPVACWPQAVAAERDPHPPQIASTAPVLFDLPDGATLSALVSEMLRLGNDRQSFRWVADADGPPRVLLRVIGPPYYTLLRALDHPTAAGVRAYTEQAPRVWVRLGWTHPLAGLVKVADGQTVLIDPPRDWRFLADAPFRDVYDALQFSLPAAPAAWADAAVEAKLSVPLKLVPGNAADAAELWVLRGDAVDQLDAFVRDADDRITQRLKFAVGSDGSGKQVVVLRTTPSKLAPPVLPLAAAVGFKPFWKLPNLYVPAGTRLHPTLRRDVVRNLLADDTDQLVWLYPGPDGAFTPETLPEDSFAPLADWVEYVIDANHAPLAAWVESSRFDFDHFVCTESPPPKPKDDKGPKAKKPDRDDTPLTPAPDARPRPKEPAPAAPKPTAFVPEEVKPPSEWLLRRAGLQDRFLRVEGPLDAPERLEIWPDLAAANAGYGDAAEAAVCWQNAAWERPDPPPAWFDGWARVELPESPHPVTPTEFDKRMTPGDPTPVEARQFAAAFLAAAHQQPVPAWLRERLPAAQKYLAAIDKKLSCRAAWLVAYRLAQLSGGDTLGLARARDRLLTRLLDDGLNPERDLPFFLRTAGLKDSDRVRLVRDKAQELHRSARAWAEKGTRGPSGGPAADGGATLAYADLMFAFALAKLGEEAQARSLSDAARQTLVTSQAAVPVEGAGVNVTAAVRKIAGGFLFDAYRFRVEEALAGRPHAGPLSPALLAAADEIAGRADAPGGMNQNPFGMGSYVVNRMRQQSPLLEPQEKLEPYAEFLKHGDELRRELADLPKLKDPNLLVRRVRELYRNGVGGRAAPDGRFNVLLAALPLSPRAGEAFTLELLGLVPEAMRDADAPAGTAPPTSELPKKQGQLLERALFLAAHFDRRDVVQSLSDQFIQLVHSKKDEQRYELINVVAGQCLRSLRKLELRDEVDRLLRRLQDEVLRGQTPAQLRAKLSPRPDAWGKALQTLLYIAGGWLSYGLTDQATPILDDARNELLTPGGLKLGAQEYTRLAQAYVAAVGHGPADAGLPRIAELFRKMPPEKVTNTFTSAPYYSRLHLNVVEEVVLALASDEFVLGPVGRRWLEEDEYLIRRRVHRDMRRTLDTAGL